MSNESRQAAVYDFLISRGDRWTSSEQITDSVSEYPAFFTSNYHDSNARRMLTFDIKQINRSGDYDKVIIHGNGGFKIATEKEAEEYVERRMAEAKRMLAATYRLAKKLKLDGQYTLDGYTIDAFLKEAEDG